MFGLDGAINNFVKLQALKDGARWTYSVITEWPAQVQINVWGINPDGQPDRTGVLGDVDGDNVLDRISPVALTPVFLNVTDVPPSPHLLWRVSLDDMNLRYELIPVGYRTIQLIIFIIMWVIPLVTSALVVYLYTAS